MMGLARLTSAAALAGVASLVVATTASAHPLGNFTINHFSEVSLAGSVVRIAAVYDLAEIPAFQEIQRESADPGQRERLVNGLAGGLHLSVDGQPLPLHLLAHRSRLLPGQAGLQTMRVEVDLESAPVSAGVHQGVFADSSDAGHLGWREVIVVPTGGAQLSSSTVPQRTISARLTSYPSDRLASPLDVSGARFTYLAGGGPAPAQALVDRAANGFRTVQDRFSSLVSARALTPAALLLSLVTAMVLGALHALEPGHGKAIMAGYLIGTRGRLRDAAALGLTITATHTSGVFALGLVTLTAANFITPERLYPVLNAISGVLVLGIGAALLVRMVRRGLPSSHPAPDHGHAHDHNHDRTHGHRHGSASRDDPHAHHHNGPGDAHGPGADHTHQAPSGRLGRLGIIGVGISGGIIPCPSALVVLLAAVSLHRVLLGLALILAFSAGLAAVLTGVGLVLAGGRGLLSRAGSRKGWRRVGRPLSAFVPAASALVVSAVGLGLTAQAFQTLR